ncbi:MAG: beta-xylosidase [Verrucomicrobiota bacterium]|jgi:xylan 1,4-beta-xylosidase
MRFAKIVLLFGVAPWAALAEVPAARAGSDFPVTITVDAARPGADVVPIWRFFGADEPNFAYLKDGQKLLGELGQLAPQKIYFRCHHLLTSGDGAYALKWGSTSAYKEDTNGTPIYDWTINDRIFDAYLEHGVKPYVQIGFMPEALSTHPQDYPHHPPVNERTPVETGQSYPPKDYVKWGNLAYEWSKHCLQKYGAAEIQQWYWEVWNEPNIGYWHGSHEDYFKLYDYAVDGVRRAWPDARVGGPETAGGPGGSFLREFLNHCAHGTNYVTGKIGSPLDFISFHAKGSPVFTNDHMRMGLSSQLKNMTDAFAVIASFKEYRETPVVIGESDPEGCAACREPRDGYRNGTMYSSYTAASFPRAGELAAQYGVNLRGALTWAFEFEDQPPFAGFRQLASDGLDLPVLNVFRLFAQMGGRRLPVTSTSGRGVQTILQSGVRGDPDVMAQASLDNGKLAVLVWHYHDDDVPGPAADVQLRLTGLPVPDSPLPARQFRVDAGHSNCYEAWKRMGEPQPPSPAQFAALAADSQLAQMDGPITVPVKNGEAQIRLNMPRQAVALVILTWPR